MSASHLRLLARTGRLKAQKLVRDWFTTEAAVASRNDNMSSAKAASKRG